MGTFTQSDLGSTKNKDRNSRNNKGLALIIAILIVALVAALLLAFQKNNAKELITGKQYSWQNDCDVQCADHLGSTAMTEIDAMSCAELRMLYGLRKEINPNEQEDYFSSKEWIAAFGDKMESISCKK